MPVWRDSALQQAFIGCHFTAKAAAPVTSGTFRKLVRSLEITRSWALPSTAITSSTGIASGRGSYRLRGRAYYLLNQFDDAMRDFEAALRIDPKDSFTISFINDLKRKQQGR